MLYILLILVSILIIVQVAIFFKSQQPKSNLLLTELKDILESEFRKNRDELNGNLAINRKELNEISEANRRMISESLLKISESQSKSQIIQHESAVQLQIKLIKSYCIFWKEILKMQSYREKKFQIL